MSTIVEEVELPLKDAPLGPKRSFIAEKYIVKLPPGLKALLEDLTRAVIKNKPPNIDVFAADFFSRRLGERARDVGTIDFPKYLTDDDTESRRKKKSLRSSLRKSKRSSGRHKDDKSSDEDEADAKKRQSCVCSIDIDKHDSRASDLRPRASDSGATLVELPGKRDTSNKARSTRTKSAKQEDPDAFRSSRQTSQSQSTDRRPERPSIDRLQSSGEKRFSVEGPYITKTAVREETGKDARRDSTTQKPSITQTGRETIRPSRLDAKKTAEGERAEQLENSRKKTSLNKNVVSTSKHKGPVSEKKRPEEPRDSQTQTELDLERTGRSVAPAVEKRASITTDKTLKVEKKRSNETLDRRSTIDESTNIPEPQPNTRRNTENPRQPIVRVSRESIPVVSPLDAALNRKTVVPTKLAAKKVPSANVAGTENGQVSTEIKTTTTPTKTTTVKTTIVPLAAPGKAPTISVIPPDETPKVSASPSDLAKNNRLSSSGKPDLLSPTDTSGTDSISVSESGTTESESIKDNDKSRKKSKRFTWAK